ncbi:MAG: hypothetical protein AAF726_17620 [Planctomycetota bacterium]
MGIKLAVLLLPIGFTGAVDAQDAARGTAPTRGVAADFDAEARGIDAHLASLERLAVERHAGADFLWDDVAGRLDALERDAALLAGTEAGAPWGGIAHAVREIAVGASRSERFELSERGLRLLALAPERADVRAVGGALLEILEPLRAPNVVGVPESPATLVYRAVLARLDEVGASAAIDASRARVARLQRGAAGPRFLARDSAGNELRSAEFAGRVVVLRFWDASSEASLAAHAADAELVRSFWDAPFELVGVASSTDRQAYLAVLEEFGFGGTQLFDGPISTHLADELAKDAHRFVAVSASATPIGATPAWLDPAPGSVVVLDAQGIIRGRDLSRDRLRSLVRSLLDEENERRRQAAAPPARSSR